jgi:hypothetical protein
MSIMHSSIDLVSVIFVSIWCRSPHLPDHALTASRPPYQTGRETDTGSIASAGTMAVSTKDREKMAAAASSSPPPTALSFGGGLHGG